MTIVLLCQSHIRYHEIDTMLSGMSDYVVAYDFYRLFSTYWIGIPT